MRNRKQGRKKRNKRERERDKERDSEKGGGQKRLKRNKGKHRNMNNKNGSFRGKTGFLIKAKRGKQRKNTPKKKTQTQKK